MPDSLVAQRYKAFISYQNVHCIQEKGDIVEIEVYRPTLSDLKKLLGNEIQIGDHHQTDVLLGLVSGDRFLRSLFLLLLLALLSRRAHLRHQGRQHIVGAIRAMGKISIQRDPQKAALNQLGVTQAA